MSAERQIDERTPDREGHLSGRREAILRAVVQGYIATSRPIGSSAVNESASLDVSPATIRKELGMLEEEGYLHQPHTSAGRIPTEKGYRYFVDTLMAPAEVGGPQFERIHEFFTRTHGELERMLRQTSTLVANLTHYASVVVGPQPDVATVRSVQLVDLAPQVVLMVAVLSNGAIERRTIELAEPVEATDFAEAGEVVSKAMVGQSLHEATAPAAIRPGVDDVVASVLDAVATPSAVPSRLYVGGASSVAGVFDATETVAQVLNILERQLLVSTLIRDVLDRGMRVAIGTETGVEPLNDCAIVVAPYLIEGEEAGSIGVLGPQRMNYAEALATVAIVSEGLSAHLSDR